MSDSIYLVDPATKTPTRIDRVSFGAIGVKERQDLEHWIVAHPELLGENLFVVTVEFHGFDKSSKRLDVLALDEDGVLVVIELKLDVAGSHADLQAIRYAAFCSTMTMQDVVDQYAANKSLTVAAAEEAVLKFLGVDELPELGDRPRVILAAGSMDDQEITSCVLWLRRFGVDISCVELTPYRMPDGAIVLVPKTIIPLPETIEYTVKVEKKEVAKVEKSKTQYEYDRLWAAVKGRFNATDCPVKVTMNVAEQWLIIKGGADPAHYAWWWLKRQKAILVGIGFRSKTAAENDALLTMFRDREQELSAAAGRPVVFQDDWGPLTRRLYATVAFDGTRTLDEVGVEAADVMARIVKATLPTLVAQGLHAPKS